MTRLVAGMAALVAVGLIYFVGTQIDREAASAAYAAERVGEPWCCGPPFTWAEVIKSVAIAAFGVPAIAALAYLTVILMKVVATGTPTTPTQPRRTYVAAAVVETFCWDGRKAQRKLPQAPC